jgi:hypothetical protein
MRTVEEANRFLKESYVTEFNRKFTVKAAQPGHAFVWARRGDLDRVFSIQHERIVNRDNTVSWVNRCLQIEKTLWRGSLAGCRVTVYEHLDGTVSLGYGPKLLGRYTGEGAALKPEDRKPTLPGEAA